jgi:hypothetical protein
VQANVTTVDTFSSTVKEVVDSGRIRETTRRRIRLRQSDDRLARADRRP